MTDRSLLAACSEVRASNSISTQPVARLMHQRAIDPRSPSLSSGSLKSALPRKRRGSVSWICQGTKIISDQMVDIGIEARAYPSPA